MCYENTTLTSLLESFHICLKLKSVLRSGFVNCKRNRKESVAEHSWMLALMVLFIAPYLDKSFSLLKALKIALIHDLGECFIGDLSLLDLLKNKDLVNKKYQEEKKAFSKILEHLNKDLRKELLALWEDFEGRESYEAKVVVALDKIEAQIQQNESEERNLDCFKEQGLLDKIEYLFSFDEFIKQLKTKVLEGYYEVINECTQNEKILR